MKTMGCLLGLCDRSKPNWRAEHLQAVLPGSHSSSVLLSQSAAVPIFPVLVVGMTIPSSSPVNSLPVPFPDFLGRSPV